TSSCYASISATFVLSDTAPSEIYTLSLHDALPISSLMPMTAKPLPIASSSSIGLSSASATFGCTIMRPTSNLPPELEWSTMPFRSEEHTSELQSRENLVCRLLLEKKKHAPANAAYR